MKQNPYEKNTVKKNAILSDIVHEIAPAVVDKLANIGKPYSKKLLEASGAVQGIVSGKVPVIGFPMHTGDYHCICYTTYPQEPRFLNATIKAKNLELGLLGDLKEIEKSEKVFLTEGIWDLLTLSELGLPALALPGVNNWNIDWISKYITGKKVYIMFDNDPPGKEYALKYVPEILRYAKETRILELPTKIGR